MSDQMLELQTQDVLCFDPECPGIAEAEVDGGYSFYTCEECGSEFGYERLEQPASTSAEPACALGVPETLRKIGSALGDPGMADRLGLTEAKPAPNSTPVAFTTKPRK